MVQFERAEAAFVILSQSAAAAKNLSERPFVSLRVTTLVDQRRVVRFSAIAFSARPMLQILGEVMNGNRTLEVQIRVEQIVDVV
jgi:hypothetical protein